MKRHNYKEKKNPAFIILFIIIAVVVIAQLTLFRSNKNLVQNKINDNASTTANIQEKQSQDNTVIIDFGNGQKKEKTVKANTPYQALEMVANSQGYKITTKQYKYGLMVEEINRIKNTPEKYWLFSVNGKPGLISADRQKLNAGDVVEWKYTSAK